MALQYENPRCVEYLLSHGADVNVSDTCGDTALTEAASRSETACVRLLIAKGANVNAKRKNGETVVFVARHSPDIVALLKAAGAKV
jgi:ankyrin repeat protein